MYMGFVHCAVDSTLQMPMNYGSYLIATHWLCDSIPVHHSTVLCEL